MNGVSIIICCYNAVKRIDPTLKHLQQQSFTKQISWEVILVDNASTDDTAHVAEQIWNGNRVTDFRVVKELKTGLMNARHTGIITAKYDIVSFIDDDNWVEPGWVQKVFNLFEANNKMGACGGRNAAVFENIIPTWFDAFKESFAVGQQANKTGKIDKETGFLWGAGLSLRKSSWEALQKKNYVNLTLDRQGNILSAGGDTELCYALRLLGYELYYDDDITLQHFMPSGRMNFAYLKKMYVGFGKANVKLNYYRVLLDPGVFNLSEWWYELLVAAKSILKYFMISKFSQKQDSRWKAGVQNAYWRGYINQVWKDRSSFKKNIDSLKIVFEK
jgi:glycosyltransferase involved in cell wall biosynthesis